MYKDVEMTYADPFYEMHDFENFSVCGLVIFYCIKHYVNSQEYTTNLQSGIIILHCQYYNTKHLKSKL